MDIDQCARLVSRAWDDSIVPALQKYIRIPNLSPQFDADWEAAGHMERAVELVRDWCEAHAIPGMSLEVVRLPGRTPLLCMEIPGSIDDTVLLYGHLDKQPPMTGWEDGLGPFDPVIRDGRLYGRGGADDGYAAFASLTALRVLHEQGLPHARCIVLIEASEESGSPDLPAYIEALEARIGTPSLVVCLDSGCGNYDQLWCTTSLRGMVLGSLSVGVLREGVHSGDASGIVPDSFRIARQLLARLEHQDTGTISLDALSVSIPEKRRAEARLAADELGGAVAGKFPFLEGVRPADGDGAALVLRRTWEPSLTITGQAGLPPLETAGNVLRSGTQLKLSFRLPPTCPSQAAAKAIQSTLALDPPQGAHVSFTLDDACDGWDAPPVADWLEAALENASQAHFGRSACSMGEGGTIPFMGMLGIRFPEAQFMITGVLGPGSNAHGPNEFLDIETGKRLTGCVAQVLEQHARRPRTT